MFGEMVAIRKCKAVAKAEACLAQNESAGMEMKTDDAKSNA